MSDVRLGRREFVSQAAVGTAIGLVVFSEPGPSLAAENDMSNVADCESQSTAPNVAPATSMNALSDLHRSVSAVIASKRIGSPVFVRYTLLGTEQLDAMVMRLAQLVVVAQAWIGQPLTQMYSVGKTDAGQVSLTLQFAGGASAQVSIGQSPRGGLDLMVIGNHGTIYHDTGAARLWDEPPAVDIPAADPGVVNLVRQALASSQPVSVTSGGRP